ncbi:hypothetical protein LCGC14_1664270 [marine sediment metagenome]|uniref:Uncharacterized protein n=1 Tax=marine sediment metagenome TaxID=412755 RepID=A0A0F9KT53_9ZZZZ
MSIIQRFADGMQAPLRVDETGALAMFLSNEGNGVVPAPPTKKRRRKLPFVSQHLMRKHHRLD